MNDKLAKRLRRQARDASIGMPTRGLVRHGNKLVNDPKTTRGVYRILKRAAA